MKQAVAAGIAVAGFLGAAAAPVAQQSEADTIRKVIRAKALEFSGTILVEKDGQIILHESAGLANRQFDVPNTATTRYRIASITKLFTAVIVLQLRDEGRVDLQKPVATYLPECAIPVGSVVTPHQLLSHTSGLADLAAIKSKEDAVRNGIAIYQAPFTADALAQKYCRAPLEKDAGTKFFYNNGDYIILGRMIEQIEGEPFEAVLARRILRPLGLRDTGMLYQHQLSHDSPMLTSCARSRRLNCRTTCPSTTRTGTRRARCTRQRPTCGRLLTPCSADGC